MRKYRYTVYRVADDLDLGVFDTYENAEIFKRAYETAYGVKKIGVISIEQCVVEE